MLITFSCSGFNLFAQQTRVTGKVSDALTNEGIPFANVAFKGTSIGTVTDINGNFVIETDKPTDSLSASYVGYISDHPQSHKRQNPNCKFPFEGK